MTLADLDAARATLLQRLDDQREQTLGLLTLVDDAAFGAQPHPDFSPIGWHLGHIAFTEALWLLERCRGDPPLASDLNRIFSTTENPKANRIYLPPRAAIVEYLHDVRARSRDFLAHCALDTTHPLLHDARIARFLLQHEGMHLETMTLVLQMCGDRAATDETDGDALHPHRAATETVRVGASAFPMGTTATGDWLDNEVPPHWVQVEAFDLDVHPVTNAQYLAFIDAGGYDTRAWWTPDGWRWRETHAVIAPKDWHCQDDGRWRHRGFFGPRSLVGSHPVIGVSWYEARAYACWIGKRLPTEAEWEMAASWEAGSQRKCAYAWGDEPPLPERCNSAGAHGWTTPVGHFRTAASPCGAFDMNGNVWEWTATAFAPYPRFAPYPYDGYSLPYFDGAHFVLRGGSWATPGSLVRNTFRNWYVPWCREIFAGFRCARSI